MEPLGRWLRKAEDAWAIPIRAFAILAYIFFIALGGLATVQAASGMALPLEAYFIVACSLAVAIWMTLLSRRHRRPSRDKTSLAALQGASFQGKLSEVLGENAPILGQAAADLEQMEALLPSLSLEPASIESLHVAGQERMRRMVDLTIDTPGRYGLTMAQAKDTILADAKWLSEVRVLVEQSRETLVDQGEDLALGHLQAFVQAREEAIEELRGRD